MTVRHQGGDASRRRQLAFALHATRVHYTTLWQRWCDATGQPLAVRVAGLMIIPDIAVAAAVARIINGGAR